MFSELNLGGQHQHKSPVIAYTGAHSRCQGLFALGKPSAQISPAATTGLCSMRVFAEMNAGVTCRADKVVFADELIQASIYWRVSENADRHLQM